MKATGNASIAHPNGAIKITNVLYAPEVKWNILSIKSFVKEGFKVIFDDLDCFLINKNTNQVRIIVKLDKKLNLWKLTKNSTKKNGLRPVQINAILQSDLAKLWYRRLAHLNYQSLQFMISKKIMTSVPYIQLTGEVCKLCMEGKQCRERFPKSAVNRATVPLEVLHTNLCGPLKAPSISRSKYFMTIIDDFSRKV
jgi:hypothetical protein